MTLKAVATILLEIFIAHKNDGLNFFLQIFSFSFFLCVGIVLYKLTLSILLGLIKSMNGV